MSIARILQQAAGAGGALDIADAFSTDLYTGNGSTQTITNGIDLAGEGGLVWTKTRVNNTHDSHNLYDTERGNNSLLFTNLTNAEAAVNDLDFNANGFDVKSSQRNNINSNDYASWTFRKAPKFFDVVTYTGDGVAGRTISHNLGIEPGMIVVKRRNSAENWTVYHRSTGPQGRLSLNTTDAVTNEAGPPFQTWNQAPDDTQFYVGSTNRNNGSGSTYVAYLFAHDTAADGVIQCGSYTGTGSSAATVNLGWEPQYVLLKSATQARDWLIFDTARGINTGGNDPWLEPNTSDTETSPVNSLEITSTGFELQPSTDVNIAGQTYIYVAIRAEGA